MREIKFRGKKLETGEWVYGDLLLNNRNPIIVAQVNREYIGKTRVIEETVGQGNHWHIETPAFIVAPETVGQYTGIKDKNNREVFEGDIYRVEEETDDFDDILYVVVVWIHEWSMFASLIVDEYNRYTIGGVKELDEPLFWTYTLEDINSPKHFHCGDIYSTPNYLKATNYQPPIEK